MSDREPKRYITRLHLKSYGLSNYQIRILLQHVERRKNARSGLTEYLVDDVLNNIKTRLSNPRILPETRNDGDFSANYTPANSQRTWLP